MYRRDSYFIDHDFPPNGRSLFREEIDTSPKKPLSGVQWKRPMELEKHPKFVVDRVSRHDIYQGFLADCWFIAGASLLASTQRELFERVAPLDQGFEEDIYTGKFHFNFWRYDEWREVIIDDYLPTLNGKLIFSRNREAPDEFWPPLLEKAYAKLYGSYMALHSGRLEDALVDMTGGISEVIKISKNKDSPNLYKLLNISSRMKTLIGASALKSESSHHDEERKKNGLVLSHSYSITGFSQIPTEMGIVDLLRMRNPWGKKEWIGLWSDESHEMKHLSRLLLEELDFKSKNEGEFWISFQDFLSNFDKIQFCHLDPDALIAELKDNEIKQSWTTTTHHGSWKKGINAGGCWNPQNENLYWKNPQFYITLGSHDLILGQSGKCTLIVSLMRKDKRDQSKIALGFEIYQFKDPTLHPLKKSKAPINSLFHAENSDGCYYSREVTRRFELKIGTYVIIPNTEKPDEEAEFLLRVLTEKQVNTGVLKEGAETTFVCEDLFSLICKDAGQ